MSDTDSKLPTPQAETRILTLIMARLLKLAEVAPVHFWRANAGKAFSRGRAITFGEAGQADIIGCVQGWFVAIEVKAAHGAQSPAQQAWQRCITESGGVYILAREVTEATDAVLRLMPSLRLEWRKDHWTHSQE